MAQNTIRSLSLLLLVSTSSAHGGYGGYPGRDGGEGSGGFAGYGGGGANPFGGGDSEGSRAGGFPESSQFLGFDLNRAIYIRSIHGILGAVAFVGLFPLGAVVMRITPGRFAIWIHALIQILAYAVYIAAAGLGIYMVQVIRPFGTSMLELSRVNFHPIIGLVILAGLFFQPLSGILHHRRFKKEGRRQIWSYFHLLAGRVLITLGIINGGLGLWVSGSSNRFKIAYGVVGGIVWVVWMGVALLSELRRRHVSKKATSRKIGKGRP